jgi:hypothetical protein
MPLRHWVNLRVLRLLVSHAVTDAVAILVFVGLFHFVEILLGSGPYADVLDRIERTALILIVVMFAGHLVYNVFKEMIRDVR